MSYVVTPSEKARAKTNPQPIGLQKSTAVGSISLIFKNIFGLPIPYLQFLVFLGLICSSIILEFSVWLLVLFSILYFAIDIFSKKQELRFFFSGFEWFVSFFIIFLLISTYYNNESFAHGLIHYRWLVLILVLPYCFQLFPGINKFLYLLIFGGLLFALFSFVQLATGYHPFISNYSSDFLFNDYIIYPVSSFLNSPATYGLIFCSISTFAWTRYYIYLERLGKHHIVFLLLGITFALSCLFTLDIRIWFLVCLSILVPSFFIKKKLFIFTFIILLACFYTVFWFIAPFRELFINLQANFIDLKQQMEIIHTQWFASIQSHTWFGDQTFSREILYNLLPSKEALLLPMKNSYLLLLKQFGIFGFIAFLIFFLQALLLNLRLLKEVPNTHTWHKVFVIATLSIQIIMHIAGLFFSIFLQSQIVFLFIVLLSTLVYFDDAYGRGIVPDDYCL